MGNNWKGVLLVAAAGLFWSSAGLFTRIVNADIWAVLFWRSLFGGGLLLAYVLVVLRKPLQRELLPIGLASWSIVIVAVAGIVAFIPALRLTAVANVAVINASLPLLAVALGWIWLCDKVQIPTLLAGLAVLAGAGLTVGWSIIHGAHPLGDLLALASTLSMGFMATAFRRFPTIDILPVAIASNFVCALVSLPMAWPLAITPTNLIWLLLFGLVQMTLGFAAFGIGAKYLPPAKTALIGTIETPLAPLWIWLFFGEPPAISTIIGGIIIVGAVIVYLLGAQDRERQPLRHDPALKTTPSR